jgi:hypothetical protein
MGLSNPHPHGADIVIWNAKLISPPSTGIENAAVVISYEDWLCWLQSPENHSQADDRWSGRVVIRGLITYHDKTPIDSYNMFVTTVASAHMLTWLHMAFSIDVEMERYVDRACGVLTASVLTSMMPEVVFVNLYIPC